MSLLLDLHAAAPWLFHYLDIIAMCFTSGSTWLFAFGHKARLRRIGLCSLIAGSLLWVGVALLGAFAGRPIYGMVIGSANTFSASLVGLWQLRRAKEIDPVYHKHLETYKRTMEKARVEGFEKAWEDVLTDPYPSPQRPALHVPQGTPDKY